MSRIYDTLRKVQQQRIEHEPHRLMRSLVPQSREARAIRMARARVRSRCKVVTLCSNKGGVGKTTLAANLAIYLRALSEDLPILVLGLDDQSVLDRMLELDNTPPEHTVATGLRAGTFKDIIRLGQYGVHYVPSAPNASELKQEIHDPLCLLETLERTQWNGLVIVDTKSDLEILTRNAVASSDLVLIPVRNDTSLQEVRKVFALFEEWSWPLERARIVLSMIDRRIKYRQGEQRDVLSLLLAEIRKLGYPLLESFISASPKVESLSTNPARRVHSILRSASGSIVHRQMRGVAEDVLTILDATWAAWEIENDFDELKTHLRRRQRSYDGKLESVRLK